jgi:methylase of polypeptide subunit release factors
MQLTNQAMGALMMALQNSLMNQTDIVPVLQGFDFQDTSDGLVVSNPPIIEVDTQDDDDTSDATSVFQEFAE